MARNEIVIPINFGIRQDINDISTSLYFKEVENGYVEDGSMRSEPSYVPYAVFNGTGQVDGYAVTITLKDNIEYFGVKIDDKFYYCERKDPDEQVVPLKEVGQFTLEDGTAYTNYDDGTMQFAQWVWTEISTAYMTRKGLPLYKIIPGSSPTSGVPFSIELVPPTYKILKGEKEVAVYVSAKYILVTKDRLFLGNLLIDGEDNPGSIMWSDINNPEDFEVTRSKEADIFNLGANANEVTGLAWTEGVVVTFTKNSIWRSDYEGHDDRFRTTVLTSNTGCIYHYSVVTVNEISYFIGKDNFYALDGLTLVPIGDPIWNWFNQVAETTKTDNIMGHYELDQDAVSWVFQRKDSGNFWCIKYSIRDKIWTTRVINDEHI